MTNLSGFYGQKDDILSKLSKSYEGIKDLSKPYNEAQMGAPLYFEDKVCLQLYEMLLMYNTQFIPGTKPAIGMCIGDFYEHEGKEYIYASSGVATANIAFLHVARKWAKLLEQWSVVGNEVENDLKKLLDFITIDEPALINEWGLELGSFYAFCGLSGTDLPDHRYLSKLEKVNQLYGTDGYYKPYAKLARKIIKESQPFSKIAAGMYQLRCLLNNKGNLLYEKEKGYLTMSSPSASGGASWFQMTSEDIIRAVPGKNNLFFLAVHSGKGTKNNIISGIGGGGSTDKSITFLVPPDLLHRFQSEMDLNPEIASKWPDYEWHKNDTEEGLFKKSAGWWKLTIGILKSKAKEILEETVNSAILGLQLDFSGTDGIAYLRPVVTKSFIERNQSELTELNLVPVKAAQERFLVKEGDSLGIFDSVFAEKERELESEEV